MYGQFHICTSWPWWTAKGSCMSETWWYILGLPLIRLLLFRRGSKNRAKILHFCLEVSYQWCICWAVEASTSSATSLVTASSGRTYLAASLSPISWTWFICLRSTGGCCVTTVPAIDSRGSWGCLCFRIHFILLFFTLPFWILLKLYSCPCSAWDITPRVFSLRTRQWCS